jgi:citrate synthase
MYHSNDSRIMRPRQIYTGHQQRDYIDKSLRPN